mmetsp:Transcript_1362/g.2203  ORF Transcript_1362/g.2203 Transcript_1362/m.2203 type:complete len:291 (-) Transcript_1362:492-1364(-)
MASPSTLFSVTGKNVLVTGGSRGIGLMIAKTFYDHGANVMITSRDGKACEEAAASIKGSNSTTPPVVHHVASNVSTRKGSKELAEHVREVFNGRLDVLVNNAGTAWGEDPYSERESGRMNWGWDKVLDLNVKGMFYLSRECLPMLERDPPSSSKNEDAAQAVTDPGRIINIGSIAGIMPQEAPTHAYDVSKAAVHHLTKKMSADLARRGVTVNCVAPGYVPSRMTAGLSTHGPDAETMGENIPLGRMGNADDMGGACLYFSSRAGSWCTGVILVVDGGALGTFQIPLSSL